MAFSDRTAQFREIVSKSSLPDVKRRKTALKRAHDNVEHDAGALLSKEYLREAYNIVCLFCTLFFCVPSLNGDSLA